MYKSLTVATSMQIAGRPPISPFLSSLRSLPFYSLGLSGKQIFFLCMTFSKRSSTTAQRASGRAGHCTDFTGDEDRSGGLNTISESKSFETTTMAISKQRQGSHHQAKRVTRKQNLETFSIFAFDCIPLRDPFSCMSEAPKYYVMCISCPTLNQRVTVHLPSNLLSH